jgi:hypothetical protein
VAVTFVILVTSSKGICDSSSGSYRASYWRAWKR